MSGMMTECAGVREVVVDTGDGYHVRVQAIRFVYVDVYGREEGTSLSVASGCWVVSTVHIINYHGLERSILRTS